MSRTEQYLAFLTGEASSYPMNPQSRVESYLLYLCQHKGEDAPLPDWVGKTNKKRIDFDGTNFTLDGAVLNYKQLHDIHLESPDFAFVVCGDRAYLLSYVQDDPDYMREMRWESSIATQTAVKTSGIYVVSNDGVEIAGVSVRDINSENQGNKVNELTEANKNSTVNYPSNAAVSKELNAIGMLLVQVRDALVNGNIDEAINLLGTFILGKGVFN